MTGLDLGLGLDAAFPQVMIPRPRLGPSAGTAGGSWSDRWSPPRQQLLWSPQSGVAAQQWQVGPQPFVGPPAPPAAAAAPDVLGPPMPPVQAPAAGGDASGDRAAAQARAGAGQALALAGAGLNVIGAYYGALAQRSTLRQQARDMDTSAAIKMVQARESERQARVGRTLTQASYLSRSIASGAEREQRVANVAARGGTVRGSAALEVATIDYRRELERWTVSVDALRQDQEARMRSTLLRGSASMDEVSAANLRRSARSISPELAAGSALVSSLGTLALGGII